MRKSIIAFATGAVVAVAAAAIVATSFAHRIDTSFSAIKLPVSSAAPVVSSPTPSVAAKPIEGDTNGDGRLSEFEKEVLANSKYTLPDGSVVKLVDGQPLPAPVQAAVTAAITPSANTFNAASPATNQQFAPAFDAALAAQESKVGRDIIVVMYGTTPNGHAWTASAPAYAPTLAGYPSKAAAIAAAEAVDAGSNQYALIVIG